MKKMCKSLRKIKRNQVRMQMVASKYLGELKILISLMQKRYFVVCVYVCVLRKSFFFNLFIFWLHWVFAAACGLSLVVASTGYSSLQCAGFSLRWLLIAEHGL